MVQPICNWQRTPDEILTEIALYLKPGELYNASLVCKNWFRVLKSSPAWFHRRFYINGIEDDKVAIDYVAKYARHLKSFTLDFLVNPNINEIEAFQDNCREFLSSFYTTSLSCLSVYSSDGAYVEGSGFGDALAEFLQTQKDLQVFELKAADLNLPISVLISILSALDKTSLRQLTLQEFTTFPGMLRSIWYLDVVGQFTKIQSLSLRHDFVSNDVLLRVAKASRGNWKKLVLSYSKLDTRDHYLSEDAWMDTLKYSPNLKVTFNIEAKFHNVRFVARFLLREGIPLAKLFIRVASDTPLKLRNQDEIKTLSSDLAKIYHKFHGGKESTFGQSPLLCVEYPKISAMICLLIAKWCLFLWHLPALKNAF